MKRTAVFAHFDKNCIIQEYVIFFIKELKKVVDRIIFVSDCDLKENEITKIGEYIDHSIIGRHGEYDFGSYKKGYLYLKDNGYLEDCDELVFVNDSCYAPLFPFEEMFNKMSKKKVDFWGNQQNTIGWIMGQNTKFIGSYFLVFKQSIFKSSVFDNFICNIKKELNKHDIIRKYEIRLTSTLEKNGFTWDVYCELSKTLRDTQCLFFKETILRDKCPFLKRSLNIVFRKYMYSILKIKKFIKENTNYDENLIDYSLTKKGTIIENFLMTILYILCRNKYTLKIVMLYTDLKLKILKFMKRKFFLLK